MAYFLSPSFPYNVSSCDITPASKFNLKYNNGRLKRTRLLSPCDPLLLQKGIYLTGIFHRVILTSVPIDNGRSLFIQ